MDKFIRLQIANCKTTVCIKVSAITAIVENGMGDDSVDLMVESGHAFRVEYVGGARAFLCEHIIPKEKESP